MLSLPTLSLQPRERQGWGNLKSSYREKGGPAPNRWHQNLTGGSGYNHWYNFNAKHQVPEFQYDAAGNVLYDGSHYYTYDAEGRVIAVDGGYAAGGSTYYYDAEGRRARILQGANQPSGLNDYVYDISGKMIAVLGDSGSLSRGEVFAGGRHLVTYANSTTYFTHADGLGTERVRTDPQGNVVNVCTSLAFGDGKSCTGPYTSANQFTGEPFDYWSGLDHFWFRDYSSNPGRWMSPDPAGLAAVDPSNPQSLNRYAYVMNNPTNLIDPLGLFDDCTTGCANPFSAITDASQRSLVAGDFGGAWLRYQTQQFRNQSGWTHPMRQAYGDYLKGVYGQTRARAEGSDWQIWMDNSRTEVINGAFFYFGGGTWVDAGGSIVAANNGTLPNGDVPVRWDIFRNSAQCPTCGNIMRNTAGAVNTAAVATMVLAAPFVVAGTAPTIAGAYWTAYGQAYNLSVYGWASAEALGLDPTQRLLRAAGRMGSPGPLGTLWRTATWAYRQCQVYYGC
ncbi:MAG: RHS repeat-associated core domain-containing protein [Acidobacteriia bacterium]|nr:RHS repeat-associated core domain-containing protein [Terriglobia bacterium]